MTHDRALVFALLAAVGCTANPTVAPLDVATDVTADASADAPVDAPKEDAAPPLAPVRATAPLVRYADPLVGTGGDGFGTGSAFPGPQRPFGLARPGPDTTNAMGDAIGYAHCAGYAHFDTHVSGFSQLHMHGTGIVDYGALGFMPVVGMTAAKTRQRGRLQPFRHARETAQPSYYRVAFDGSEVVTEVTATDHVALYRVTFPRGADGNLVFDVGHVLPDVRITDGSVEVDAATGELRGRVLLEGAYSDRVGGVEAFWVARASRPLTAAGTWSDGVIDASARARTGANVGAFVPVDTRESGVVTVAIGLSLTDVAHARANLAAEAADLDFDRVRAEGTAQWESLLGRVQATARGEPALRTLYSAVYHTLLMPTLVSDVDGAYRGIDRMPHRAEGFRYYSDLSLWDTFRTEHPWLTAVYPEYQRDFVRSLLAMSEVAGYFPRWPLGTGETGGMLGDCGALMVADTYIRGLRDFDVARAWEVARRSAFSAPTRRSALGDYASLRYVPVEAGGSSASLTMEYAYADGALAAMARDLGHTEDAAALARRSESYKNLWDPAQNFLVGRRRDGAFVPLTGTTIWQPVYAEGAAWQYLWYAPHDLAGLAATMGGRDAMLARLDEMFELSIATPRTPLPDRYYWHGNEPDIHAPWIPSFFDDAARSSRYVDWVRTTRYGDGPDGIPGNDDAGTMSAWYIFAALGAFPIAGTDTWLLAAPAVTSADVTLAGGAVLRVRAPEAGTGALRPTALRWNGEALARPTLTHAMVARGGELAFELSR
jgi:predicted alpha-1,2-mannosidase